MLRVGLTGGIGAGKSTAARRLAGLGAVLVDADVLAREVVAPGTAGLAAVVAAFGADVLAADGSLDRPALGRLVFGDAGARAQLNGIVHPLVAARRAALVAAAPPDAVVVEDVPLLVETGQAPAYPLVVVVDADVAERRRRLVQERGTSPADADARIAAQADDGQRRAAADVVLPNPRRGPGEADPLAEAVEALWRERLVPFEQNLRAGLPAPRPTGAVDVPGGDAERAAQGARVVARVRHALGGRARSVEHTGPTAVPGLAARGVLDVQVVVDDLAAAGRLAAELHPAGLVAAEGSWWDRLTGAAPEDASFADKAFAVNADPGLAVNCHLRPADSPAWRQTLALRDALRADAALRAEYAALDVGPETDDGTHGPLARRRRELVQRVLHGAR